MSEKKPPRDPRQTQWSRNWNKNNLDRLSVTVPKGIKSLIQAHAEKNKETVNGMIARLLRRELGLSESEWKRKDRKD